MHIYNIVSRMLDLVAFISSLVVVSCVSLTTLLSNVLCAMMAQGLGVLLCFIMSLLERFCYCMGERSVGEIEIQVLLAW
jgi:hypothetical protein